MYSEKDLNKPPEKIVRGREGIKKTENQKNNFLIYVCNFPAVREEETTPSSQGEEMETSIPPRRGPGTETTC